jgi:predicted nuclease of restriction endonuclease-like (RecB) superfamily
MPEPLAPDSYGQFLVDLKGRIRNAQLRASMAVNRELVMLYWRIGSDILDRQHRENWGAKVIDRLAAVIRRAFSDMKGFSPRNLKYRRAFGEAWPDEAIVQQLVAQISWGRQGKAVANFERTLPAAQSDLARDITKDPYNFDFLTLGDDAHERDPERGLLNHLRLFLLELGVGFAFVGSQYQLAVGDGNSTSIFSSS